MSLTWSVEQVQALAPSTAAFIAARRSASAFSETGCDGPHVWGLCQGTGKAPYRVRVNVQEAVFRCSCPVQAAPCKHALGLLLLCAGGSVPEAIPPDWARLDPPRKRAPKGPPSEAAMAARSQRVTAGVAELREWLRDQVRHGFAGLEQAGYRHFEQMAARLVDAQAPGLASAVRGLGSVASSGAGWESRFLTQLSLVYLLTGDLPDQLADVMRVRIGYSLSTEQVLAGPRVRDHWQVIGIRDSYEERLSVRRVWLIGRDTGREALVLSFAGPGAPLPAELMTGTVIDADLCFYPGIRALVAATDGVGRWEPAGMSIGEALGRLTDGLAADPWLESWPVLLRGTVIPGERWHVMDAHGDGLPFDARSGEQWRFLAASGGEPAVIAAEWTWNGLIPLAMDVDGELVLP